MLCPIGHFSAVIDRCLFIQLSMKHFFNHAVNFQIGISADGRGKVAIIFCSQPKMSAIFRRISCLHHAPQHHSGDNPFLVRFLCLLQNLLQLSRVNLPVLFPQIIAKATQELLHFFQLILIRLLMATIHERHFLPEGIFRDCFVAHQHKFLNHICRNAFFIRLDVNRLSVFIQNDFRFGQIKIHRPAFSSFFSQNLPQLLHILQHGQNFRILLQ